LDVRGGWNRLGEHSRSSSSQSSLRAWSWSSFRSSATTWAPAWTLGGTCRALAPLRPSLDLPRSCRTRSRRDGWAAPTRQRPPKQHLSRHLSRRPLRHPSPLFVRLPAAPSRPRHRRPHPVRLPGPPDRRLARCGPL